MTGQLQSDVEFYGESYDGKHMTGAHWIKKFYTKNLEKVEKIMNIQEYSEKFLHISALLDLYYHLKRPKVMYLSTGKTSKNPRNSA